MNGGEIDDEILGSYLGNFIPLQGIATSLPHSVSELLRETDGKFPKI